MPRDSRSFFEKLTGSVKLNDDLPPETGAEVAKAKKGDWLESPEEGELTLDRLQTDDAITLQTTREGA